MKTLLRNAAVAAALLGAACERAPAEPGTGLGELQIHAAVNSPTVATLVVEVTAPDLTDPLVFNFELVEGVAGGTIVVPAGGRRTIAVRAFDADAIQTHEGQATVAIRPGPNPAVRITLRPRTGQQPIDIVLGTFTVTVEPVEAQLGEGDALQMAAKVTDVDGTLVAGSEDVVWASDAPAVARVDAAGLVKALRAGSARIVASFGGVAAAAQITVDDIITITFDNGVSCAFGFLTDAPYIESGMTITTAFGDPHLHMVDSGVCFEGGTPAGSGTPFQAVVDGSPDLQNGIAFSFPHNGVYEFTFGGAPFTVLSLDIVGFAPGIGEDADFGYAVTDFQSFVDGSPVASEGLCLVSFSPANPDCVFVPFVLDPNLSNLPITHSFPAAGWTDITSFQWRMPLQSDGLAIDNLVVRLRGP